MFWIACSYQQYTLFFLVLLKKKKLSSWRISLHSLNIWAAFYLREAGFWGEQLNCWPLRPRADITAQVSGLRGTTWRLSPWELPGASWSGFPGRMQTCPLHYVTVTGLYKISRRVVPSPSEKMIGNQHFGQKNQPRRLPAISESAGQFVLLSCSGCLHSSVHAGWAFVGCEICWALGVKYFERDCVRGTYCDLYVKVPHSFLLFT